MSTTPARIADVRGKGAIEMGARADLVVFAPEETITIDARELHHKNKLTAYDGDAFRSSPPGVAGRPRGVNRPGAGSVRQQGSDLISPF